MARLRDGKVPVKDLLVSQKLSREVEAYRVPSPAALAGKQLMEMGIQQVRPGMRMRFWFVRSGVKVADVKPNEIDIKRYRCLVKTAAEEILMV